VSKSVICDYNSAKISWLSKHNGSEEQVFIIEKKTATESSLTSVGGVSYQDMGEGSTMKATITGLQEGTHYAFTVYAKNAIGFSELGITVNCTTSKTNILRMFARHIHFSFNFH